MRRPALMRCRRSAAAIRALRTARDLEDDDKAAALVDDVVGPELPDAHSPEIRSGDLRHTGWTRVDRQGEDRTAEARSIARRKSPQLTLGGRCQLDSMRPLAHSRSER